MAYLSKNADAAGLAARGGDIAAHAVERRYRGSGGVQRSYVFRTRCRWLGQWEPTAELWESEIQARTISGLAAWTASNPESPG